MQARFQISTLREQTVALPYPPSSPSEQPVVRFLADSKALSSGQQPLARTFLVIGLGRAFTEMPANLKVFHPEAARRDL